MVAQRSQTGLMLVADQSPTVRRLVSPRKGRESSHSSGDISVTDRRFIND